MMTATAFNERREQDLRKLEVLAEQSNRMIRIVSVSGNPISQIVAALLYKTAPNRRYPHEVSEETHVQIDPFQSISIPRAKRSYQNGDFPSKCLQFGENMLRNRMAPDGRS